MARKGNYTEPWIKVVTALSIIGLVTLVTALIYFYMQRDTSRRGMGRPMSSRTEKQYKKVLSQYKALQQKWIRPLAPHRVHTLEARVEVPLDIVRNNRKYQRPKNRQVFLRERIDRLENNITLLKKTQRQERAIKNLDERITRLRKIDVLY